MNPSTLLCTGGLLILLLIVRPIRSHAVTLEQENDLRWHLRTDNDVDVSFETPSNRSSAPNEVFQVGHTLNLTSKRGNDIDTNVSLPRLKVFRRSRRQLGGGQLPPEIQIQQTAPIFRSRLYKFGTASADDRQLPDGLDVGFRFKLQRPLVFGGQPFSTIYILSNGGVSFEQSARSFQTDALTASTGRMLIAPLWNRNDLKKGGAVYYREVTKSEGVSEGRVIERGASEIRYQYDKTVTVLSAIVVTWQKMQPVASSDPLPDLANGSTLVDQIKALELQSESHTNTFQAVIFTTDNGTYANFIYSNMGWTQGGVAGFTAGDGRTYYALPTSGTDNIQYLADNGNTGIPGEWIFQIDMPQVVRCKPGKKGDACDLDCAPNEWGYDCRGCCHCADGQACHSVSGDCAGGETCAQCWKGPPSCQTRQQSCRVTGPGCAHNAISFTDYDRCGEPTQQCQCLSGYTGDGKVGCRDLNECDQQDTCHVNAVCTNTPGSYFCQCLKGFSGDGQTVCKAAFLYEYENHQKLPGFKGSKVAWNLRQPMKIFGKIRRRFSIASRGLVALEDAPIGDGPLEESGMSGFAPFFGDIDISLGGTVFVDETTDPDVLVRATRSVADNFHDVGFVADSVFIVTYKDVKSRSDLPGNTFQINLISGTNAVDAATYVEYLYKDLSWSLGAQATIVPSDADNSIILPGSGSEGLTQLTKLSNIHKAGHWIFRVDQERILPCPQLNMQPPYCDSNNLQRETTKRITRPPTTPLPLRSTTNRAPTFPPFAPSTSLQLTGQPGNTRPPSPRIQPPVPQRPIPDDRSFRVTFPPFITVIPDLVTPFAGGRSGGRPDGLSFGEGPIIQPVFPNDRTTPTKPLNNGPPFAVPFQPRVIVPQLATTAPPSRQPPVFPPFTDDGRGGAQRTLQPRPTPRPFSTAVPTVPFWEQGGGDPSGIDHRPLENTNDVTDAPAPPVFFFTTPRRAAPVTSTRRSPSAIITAGNSVTNNNNVVVARGGNQPQRNNEQYRPFDGSGDVDDDASKLAIIIPTAIVLAWLLLLLIIGIVVCCKRRKAKRSVQTAYTANAYRPHHVGGGAAGLRGAYRPAGPSAKQYSNGSYEDHLEKAARVSSEMSHYNQNGGRISLYGSYWNLASGEAGDPVSSVSDGSPKTTGVSARRQATLSSSSYHNQAYYDSCPDFQRGYVGGGYNGRY